MLIATDSAFHVFFDCLMYHHAVPADYPWMHITFHFSRFENKRSSPLGKKASEIPYNLWSTVTTAGSLKLTKAIFPHVIEILNSQVAKQRRSGFPIRKKKKKSTY